MVVLGGWVFIMSEVTLQGVENVRPILSQTRSRKISCVSAQDTDQLDSGSRRETEYMSVCERGKDLESAPLVALSHLPEPSSRKVHHGDSIEGCAHHAASRVREERVQGITS